MTVTPPETDPNGSILTTVKQALGLAADYTAFDNELIMHINSVLADLNQLGFGPDGGFEIEDATKNWSDFLVVDFTAETLAPEPRYNAVKSYMYLRVRMLFDPPTVGYQIDAMQKLLDRAEWRINIAREDIVHPAPPPAPPPDCWDPYGEEPYVT